MGKELTEELKNQISELYRTSDMTNFEIAKTLGVSSRSVRRHKNYGYQEESVQPESYDQNIESCQEIEQEDQDIDSQEELEQDIETSEDYDPSEEESIEDTEEPTCQECGTPKSKWWTIDQAVHYGWKTKEKELWAWDYVCPKCESPQSLKKCPDCGADISHFININETNVTEEQKQKYDFVCSNCNELINIDDL